MSSNLETAVTELRKRLLNNYDESKKELLISSDTYGKNNIKLTDSEDVLKQLLSSLEDRRVYIHGVNPRNCWADHGRLRCGMKIPLKLSEFLPNIRFRDYLLRLRGIDLGAEANFSPKVNFDPFYPELIKVGKHVSIGSGAKVSAHIYDWYLRDGRPISYVCIGEVVIEDYATIGPDASIGPGIKICRYSTVTANSVPKRTVPENHIAIGNPARILPKNQILNNSEDKG